MFQVFLSALQNAASWFVGWITAWPQALTALSWGLLDVLHTGVPFDLSDAYPILTVMNYWFPVVEAVGLLTMYMTTMLTVWSIRLAIKLIPTIG